MNVPRCGDGPEDAHRVNEIYRRLVHPDQREGLRLTVESDRTVVFGDGVEADALQLTWGQSVRLGIAATALRLLT